MSRLVAIATIVAMLVTLSGCERYALNRQMEELCKKDGGVKIYETVTLSPTEYEAIWKYAGTAATPAREVPDLACRPIHRRCHRRPM